MTSNNNRKTVAIYDYNLVASLNLFRNPSKTAVFRDSELPFISGLECMTYNSI